MERLYGAPPICLGAASKYLGQMEAHEERRGENTEPLGLVSFAHRRVQRHIVSPEISILDDLDVRAPPMDFQLATTHSCFHSITVAMSLKLHGIRFSVLVSLVEGPRG